MRMEVWLPCRFVLWILIMPFISVHVYLDGSDAPPLMHSIDIVQQIVHLGVWLDVYHTLTNGTTAFTDSRFTIFVLILHILLLHGPASFFLDQCLQIVVVLLKGNTLHAWCDIDFVVVGQFKTYIYPCWIERLDIVLVPSIVSFALSNVARLDMLRCFCYCCHIFSCLIRLYYCAIAPKGYRGVNPDWWVQGESHFLLRVLRGRCH